MGPLPPPRGHMGGKGAKDLGREASAELSQGVKWLIGTQFFFFFFYWLIKPPRVFHIIWFLQAPSPMLKKRKGRKQQQKAGA